MCSCAEALCHRFRLRRRPPAGVQFGSAQETVEVEMEVWVAGHGGRGDLSEARLSPASRLSVTFLALKLP